MKILFTTAFLLTSIYSFSQTATYPVKEEGNFVKYISKDSIVIKKGDELMLGLPYNGSEFTFITQGGERVRADLAGVTVEIKKLKIIKKNNSHKMYAYFKGYGILPVMIDVEMALKTMEIELLEN